MAGHFSKASAPKDTNLEELYVSDSSALMKGPENVQTPAESSIAISPNVRRKSKKYKSRLHKVGR